jgi:hypothetical protein
MMRPAFALSIAVLAVCVGCDRAPAATSPRSSDPSPRLAAEAGDPAPGDLTGTVLETMDAGGYTYLRLQTGAGPVWAAVTQAKVAKGDRVEVEGAITMEDFESPTLGRRFDRIVFGALAPTAVGAPGRAAPAGEAVPPAMVTGLAAQHAAAAAGPAEVGPIQLARAPSPDGKTIAEVFAGRAALDATSVAVRGKVVKFSPGIMGRNWLHLRDGTGSPERKDHDLTVTMAEMAAVGDVVLVRGIVRKDRDFGAGYTYPVIVEEAKLSR